MIKLRDIANRSHKCSSMFEIPQIREMTLRRSLLVLSRKNRWHFLCWKYGFCTSSVLDGLELQTWLMERVFSLSKQYKLILYLILISNSYVCISFDVTLVWPLFFVLLLFSPPVISHGQIHLTLCSSIPGCPPDRIWRAMALTPHNSSLRGLPFFSWVSERIICEFLI